jgi:hypothetical protein
MGGSVWLDDVFVRTRERSVCRYCSVPLDDSTVGGDCRRCREEIRAATKAKTFTKSQYCRYCNSPLGGMNEHDCLQRCPTRGFGTCTEIVGHTGPCTDAPPMTAILADGQRELQR